VKGRVGGGWVGGGRGGWGVGVAMLNEEQLNLENAPF